MKEKRNRACLLFCVLLFACCAGIFPVLSVADAQSDSTGRATLFALTADFTASPISGVAPLMVEFTDQSTGDITSWQWNFGDGGTSGTPNPVHIYSSPGIYTVSLTVNGPDGTVSKIKNNYITVFDSVPAPVADFKVDSDIGKAPFAAQFRDMSSGEITNWEWDFGDGGTSTEPNPRHTYTTPGKYTVMLVVKGPAGRDTETRTDYITVTDANGLLSYFKAAPTEGAAPLEVYFLDKSAGEISKWLWSFGDGSSSTDRNPKHTYTTPGTYTVALTVTDSQGNSNKKTRTDYITVNASAGFTGSPTSGVAPLTVQFQAASATGVTSWSWNFGDGQTSTEPNPRHTYTNPGQYTVSLTVTDSLGTRTETKPDYITVTPITGVLADFTAAPTSGPTPLSVDFTDKSQGEITSWNWDFGDGGTSTEQNPRHTYMTPGSFTVSLTVTGPNGTDTKTQADAIFASGQFPVPVADFQAVPLTGPAPLTVNFTDDSTGRVTSWEWKFGDGSTSDEQNPQHIYQNPGEYTVTLTVDGPNGTDSIVREYYIKVTAAGPPPPSAGFTADPTSGPVPLTVQFTDQSTGEITSWEWNFGDSGEGRTSTQQNPRHTYTAPGIYTVSLTVRGPGGADIRIETGYITVVQTPSTAPFAQFTAIPTAGSAPLSVQFSDESVGEINSWLWNFGDGDNSTQQNPSHTYLTPGRYDVSLTVTGPGGFGSRTKTSYIAVTETDTSVVADFAATPTLGDAPLGVKFLENTRGEISSWNWDFGDGGTSDQPNPEYVYENPGTYTVTLTVTGPGGSDTKIRENFITVTTPDWWEDRLIPTVGGAEAGKTVEAEIDTDSVEQFKLLLSQQAIDGRGRIYISMEIPSVPEWKDYMWFRPRDTRIPPPPPYLILVKDTFGYFPNVAEEYYFDGTLSTTAGDLIFKVKNFKSLKGQTLIFKSLVLEFGMPFNPETLNLIQSVKLTFK